MNTMKQLTDRELAKVNGGGWTGAFETNTATFDRGPGITIRGICGVKDPIRSGADALAPATNTLTP